MLKTVISIMSKFARYTSVVCLEDDNVCLSRIVLFNKFMIALDVSMRDF